MKTNKNITQFTFKALLFTGTHIVWAKKQYRDNDIKADKITSTDLLIHRYLLT